MVIKYEGVIFDLDGTLVDTYEHYIVSCIGKTLHQLGYVRDISRREDYFVFAKRFWAGVKNRNIFVQEEFGCNPEDFWNTFATFDSTEQRVKHSFAYYDCYILEELKREGFKLGLCTDAPEETAKLELALLPIQFDCVVCADSANGIPEKPNPCGLLKCLEGLNLSTNQALFLGNANVDVVTGRNAGVRTGVVVREPKYSYVSSSDFYVTDLIEFREKYLSGESL